MKVSELAGKVSSYGGVFAEVRVVDAEGDYIVKQRVPVVGAAASRKHDKAVMLDCGGEDDQAIPGSILSDMLSSAKDGTIAYVRYRCTEEERENGADAGYVIPIDAVWLGLDDASVYAVKEHARFKEMMGSSQDESDSFESDVEHPVQAAQDASGQVSVITPPDDLFADADAIDRLLNGDDVQTKHEDADGIGGEQYENGDETDVASEDYDDIIDEIENADDIDDIDLDMLEALMGDDDDDASIDEIAEDEAMPRQAVKPSYEAGAREEDASFLAGKKAADGFAVADAGAMEEDEAPAECESVSDGADEDLDLDLDLDDEMIAEDFAPKAQPLIAPAVPGMPAFSDDAEADVAQATDIDVDELDADLDDLMVDPSAGSLDDDLDAPYPELAQARQPHDGVAVFAEAPTAPMEEEPPANPKMRLKIKKELIDENARRDEEMRALADNASSFDLAPGDAAQQQGDGFSDFDMEIGDDVMLDMSDLAGSGFAQPADEAQGPLGEAFQDADFDFDFDIGAPAASSAPAEVQEAMQNARRADVSGAQNRNAFAPENASMPSQKAPDGFAGGFQANAQPQMPQQPQPQSEGFGAQQQRIPQQTPQRHQRPAAASPQPEGDWFAADPFAAQAQQASFDARRQNEASPASRWM